jgi:hypothetical protein
MAPADRQDIFGRLARTRKKKRKNMLLDRYDTNGARPRINYIPRRFLLLPGRT